MITYPIKQGCAANIKQSGLAVALDRVSKKYPLLSRPDHGASIDFKAFWALKELSLNVANGEILGVIGRNGAGKTTLLNIIAGVLSPNEGDVYVAGKVMGLFNLGVGFQEELTGRENVFLNGAILGASRNDLESKLNAIIEFSELGGFIDMPLGTFSQGMKLRLGFSILANLDFDTLVIDEVLAVGDTLFQNKCFQRLMDFKREGRTLVISTQNLDLVERLCDRAVLLDHGKLIFEGLPKEAAAKYAKLLNSEKFFVGSVDCDIQHFTETKRWANTSGWGRRLGTKEVVIEKVKFLNKSWFAVKQAKTGKAFRIKVWFKAKNEVKNSHFGVAIFRKDGVYCYGPNTSFDGINIPILNKGRGTFTLSLDRLWLAPGEYVVSVAIWDKNETLAYDYHEGYYKLIVAGGNNCDDRLLNIPHVIRSRKHTCADSRTDFEVLPLNRLGQSNDVFMTNEPMRWKVVPGDNAVFNKDCSLWVGLYRDDGIFCQAVTQKLTRSVSWEINFAGFPLLPGGYSLSCGIWDRKSNKFRLRQDSICQFRMVSYNKDHGTVYMPHKWALGTGRIK